MDVGWCFCEMKLFFGLAKLVSLYWCPVLFSTGEKKRTMFIQTQSPLGEAFFGIDGKFVLTSM